MGDQHNEIVKILAKLCCESIYSKVYAHHISEEYEPLLITLPRRGRALAEPFYPDIWAERKHRGIDVYEVWHTESESDAIQDILYPALTKNIKYLHIVCTGYNITEQRAHDLVDLILTNLKRKGYQGLHPDYVYIVAISEEILDNKKAIKRHLKKSLGF